MALNSLQQSAAGRPWVLGRCSSHKSHSCSWCLGRGVYTTSREWAARNENRTVSGVSASASKMGNGEKDGHAGTYFAIPAQGQVFGVVNDLVLFIFTFTLTDLLFLFFFSLFSCPCLLALDIFMSEMSLFLSQVHKWKGKSEKSSEKQEGKFPLFSKPVLTPRSQGQGFLSRRIKGSSAFVWKLLSAGLPWSQRRKSKVLCHLPKLLTWGHRLPQNNGRQSVWTLSWASPFSSFLLVTPSLRWEASNLPWISPHSSPASILFPDLSA